MTGRVHLKPAPLLTIAVVVVALLVLAACGGSSQASGGSGGSSSAATSVTIVGSAFTPAKLTVKAGTTVTWTNKDPVPHDVTSTDGLGLNANTTSLFGSGSMNQGGTFSFTFTKAGTYYYECTIHKMIPAMHAVVIVK